MVLAMLTDEAENISGLSCRRALLLLDLFVTRSTMSKVRLNKFSEAEGLHSRFSTVLFLERCNPEEDSKTEEALMEKRGYC